MKTKRLLILSAVLCLTATASMLAGSAHLGVWKLDKSKSKIAPDSPVNQTVTYAEGKEGMITLTVAGVGKEGKALNWTWTGKFDGKPYKVEGNNDLFDMIAYTAVNDHTNTGIATKDGKEVSTVTIEVAKDGKTRTVTNVSTDADGKKKTDVGYFTKE